MIVNETARGVERFGTTTEQTFIIKATGKAFRILSSSLYRNKIQAIIRELSCNAYDAHVAAGCRDKPFHVHLPNRIEPWFAVRDDGIGLSIEGVMSVYTTYFESTKTGSNDFIGALGLGSKSPFSYVDSFTVASRFDGVLTTYAAFINEAGQPTITVMAEEPTSKGNGVEVSLPVARNEDFREFQEEAVNVLSRFKVRPEIVGIPDFRFREHKVILEGTGWAVPERSATSRYDAESFAMMGNVAYPISSKAIKSLSADAQSVLGAGLDIEFPIGALDVTAGREDLSYDKPTLAALEARAQAILADSPVLFQKQFDKAENEFAARRLYNKLFGHYGIGFKLVSSKEKPSFLYRGKVIDGLEFPLTEADMEGLVLHFYGDSSRRYRANIYAPHESRQREVLLPCNEQLIIALDDLPGRGAISRINELRKTNAVVPVVLVQCCVEGASFDKLLAATEGFQIKNVSELAKPGGPRGAVVRAKKLSAMATGYDALEDGSWEDVDLDDVDATEGGIFTLRRGDQATLECGSVDNAFLKVVRIARRSGLLDKDTPIYGFHKQVATKLAGQGRWISLRDAVREAVENKVTDPAVMRLIMHRAQVTEFMTQSYTVQRAMPVLRRIAKHLPEGHPVRVLVEDEKNASAERPDLEALSALCDILKLHPQDQNTPTFGERYLAIMEEYPLMVVTQGYDTKIDTRLLADYILWSDTRKVTSTTATV